MREKTTTTTTTVETCEKKIVHTEVKAKFIIVVDIVEMQ